MFKDKFHLVSNRTLTRVLSHLQGASEIAIDLETTGFDYFNDKIVGISMACEEGAYYFPVAHLGENVDEAVVKDWLKVNCDKRYIGQNIKFDFQFILVKYGIELRIMHDSMIMASVLDTNRSRESGLGLKQLMIDVLKWEDVKDYTDLFGDIDLTQVPAERVFEYGCKDAWATLQLKNIFITQISQYASIYRMEVSLIKYIAKMEINGVLIDKEMLAKLKVEFVERIKLLVAKIHKVIGPDVDLDSTEQLSKALVAKLGMGLKVRTEKSGRLKLDKDILEDFAEKFPIARQILDYRKYSKLAGTFLEHLMNDINPVTGRIHCKFYQVGVASGRMSSSSPNMQQIPVEKEFNLRKAIVSPPGFTFVSIDFNQIEVRMMLSLCKSKIGARLNTRDSAFDLHRELASIVFGKPLDKITKEERSSAKAVTFGIAFGQNEYGLAKSLGVSIEKARAIIKMYFERVDGLKELIDKTHLFVQKHGYITTLWGRKWRLPEAQIEVKDEESKYEFRKALRRAFNGIIQGSASDVVKLAMVKVGDLIDRKYKDKVKMVLAVHDSILVEVSDSLDLKEVTKELQSKMEVSIGGVLFTIAAEAGKSWGEMKGI